MPDDAIDEILYGSDERIKIKSTLIHTSSDYFVTYEGIVKYIQMMQEKDASATAQKWAEQFAKTDVCPECKSARLNKEALHSVSMTRTFMNWQAWILTNCMTGCNRSILFGRQAAHDCRRDFEGDPYPS